MKLEVPAQSFIPQEVPTVALMALKSRWPVVTHTFIFLRVPIDDSTLSIRSVKANILSFAFSECKSHLISLAISLSQRVSLAI